MNKFKFRVWSNNKRFGYFSPETGPQLPEKVTIQLCSGKISKDGKPIYQGDIVTLNNKSVNTKKEYWLPIYEVTWDGFTFGLKYLGGGLNPGATMFAFQNYPEKLEILGNIFESTIIIPKES